MSRGRETGTRLFGNGAVFEETQLKRGCRQGEQG